MHECVCMCESIYAWVWVYECVYEWVCVSVYQCIVWVCVCEGYMCVRLCMCETVHVCERVCMHACMYVCVWVCVCMCMYVIRRGHSCQTMCVKVQGQLYEVMCPFHMGSRAFRASDSGLSCCTTSRPCLYFHYLCLLIYCVCIGTHVLICMMSEDNLGEVPLSFYHMSPGDWRQVTRLNWKHFTCWDILMD